MPNIKLTQPISPEYMYMPKDGVVHIMVPVIDPNDIENPSTARDQLRSFFSWNGIHKLESYKSALTFDMGLFQEGEPQQLLNKQRLEQIDLYIDAIKAMQNTYGRVIERFLEKYDAAIKAKINGDQEPLQNFIGMLASHHGYLCINFADIVDPTAAATSKDPDYFNKMRQDFKSRPRQLPDQNEFIVETVEVDPRFLLGYINDEQLLQLPKETQEELRRHPDFPVSIFLHDIAKGRQEEAELALCVDANRAQIFLRTKGTFTDHSLREFNSTGLEYAFWAMDIEMGLMLKKYMTKETESELSPKIEEIIATGLVFNQNGKEYRTNNFDPRPLMDAYGVYSEGYGEWFKNPELNELYFAALRNIGKHQRDLPAPFVQAFCAPIDRFDVIPRFKVGERTRVQTMTYTDRFDKIMAWYPLDQDPYDGYLGERFGIKRDQLRTTRGQPISVGYPNSFWGFGDPYPFFDRDFMMACFSARKEQLELLRIKPSLTEHVAPMEQTVGAMKTEVLEEEEEENSEKSYRFS